MEPDAERLFIEYRYLAHYLARNRMRSMPTNIDSDAIYAAADVGLWRASEKYEPSIPIGFTTFAGKYIKWSMSDELRRQVPWKRGTLPEAADLRPYRTWTSSRRVRPEEFSTTETHDLDSGSVIEDSIGEGLASLTWLQREVIRDAVDGVPIGTTARRLGTTVGSAYASRCLARRNLRKWRKEKLAE